jgi:beta-lactam-binding protein with PASTA domain
VPRGSEVYLVVAEPAPTVRVPAVVGLLENTAVEALEAAGLEPVLRRVPIPAGDPRHARIVLQGISVDSDVPPDTTIEIVTGVDPNPRPVPTTSLPPLVTTPPTSTPTTTAAPGGRGP